MKINSAEFMIGAAAPGQFPPPFVPEVAFVGKSNVGKSSLINTLLNRKHLVKTSSTPGKTREINFFLINGGFRFVDLPGYGFSRAAKTKRDAWEGLIETYLTNRACLKGLVMILDIRHAPTALDQAMIAWLEEVGLRFVLVANKADKLSKSQLSRQVAALRKNLSGSALSTGLSALPLPFSAKSRVGRDSLWGQLRGWLAEPLDQGEAGKQQP
jgi:GTP-binding protein